MLPVPARTRHHTTRTRSLPDFLLPGTTLNIRRFWQQGISDFQLPEAELRAIGVTNPAGLNRRMFPMNKRVVYYFTTMRLIGLEVRSVPEIL